MFSFGVDYHWLPAQKAQPGSAGGHYANAGSNRPDADSYSHSEWIRGVQL
jgi:hypothetical protein